jgi:hypothetical protein
MRSVDGMSNFTVIRCSEPISTMRETVSNNALNLQTYSNTKTRKGKNDKPMEEKRNMQKKSKIKNAQFKG